MTHPKHIAHDLLSEAHPPDTASALFTDKVLHKPLHVLPSSRDPTSQDARAQRRLQRLRRDDKKQGRNKVKRLSAKEKRQSGIYDIPDTAKKYEIYVPLNRLWVGYMWEILGMKEGEQAFVTANNSGSKLASADYHGAELMVVRSRCVNMVGLTGIVVRDTKFTFQIITKGNELKSMWLSSFRSEFNANLDKQYPRNTRFSDLKSLKTRQHQMPKAVQRYPNRNRRRKEDKVLSLSCTGRNLKPVQQTGRPKSLNNETLWIYRRFRDDCKEDLKLRDIAYF